MTDSTTTEERDYFLNKLGPKEEKLAKIKSYEEMYRQIRNVTGVKDVTEMVGRFQSQIETMKHLNDLKSEGESMIAALEKELKNLKIELDDLKYTGEAELGK